jgi:diamine N-acetyltransferase
LDKAIKFVLADSKDSNEILEMMREFNSFFGYAFDRGKTGKNLEIFLSNKEMGRLWVIKAGGSIAGYMVLAFGFSFEHNGRDAFIDELYVKEEHRGTGIGTAAMKFLEHEAPGLGVKALHLEVEKGNEAGSRLYKANGFSGTGRELLNKKLSQ